MCFVLACVFVPSLFVFVLRIGYNVFCVRVCVCAVAFLLFRWRGSSPWRSSEQVDMTAVLHVFFGGCAWVPHGFNDGTCFMSSCVCCRLCSRFYFRWRCSSRWRRQRTGRTVSISPADRSRSRRWRRPGARPLRRRCGCVSMICLCRRMYRSVCALDLCTRCVECVVLVCIMCSFFVCVHVCVVVCACVGV